MTVPITEDPLEIEGLLALTISEIQVDKHRDFLQEKEFNQLPRMDKKVLKELIETIAVGKAITLDALTDCMFRKENIERTAEIFQDLWCVRLDKIKGIEAIFTSRLIALNKRHSEIPTRLQFRPILICSPLQKLLEIRFLPKLANYMSNRMFAGQTGFVKGLGIQVNLNRAVDRIRTRTDNKRACLGLFVDFANAFNSVSHSLLFAKLRQKGCLDEDEIKYLENLYARYRIRIGNRFIRVNKGVAQGSLISPALFNIFLEDLAVEISGELGIPKEDIMLYADDILILTPSVNQLRKVIQIIERWSLKNCMSLNKTKSGIVPFASRKGSEKSTPFMMRKYDEKSKTMKWKPARSELEGIPILSEYKYLGTILDFKLRLEPQLEKIKEKSHKTFIRLYPYLVNASAESRRDLWFSLVAPLFHTLFALMGSEDFVSPLKNVFSVWRMSFKEYMLLPKRLDDDIVYEMIGVNLAEWATHANEIAVQKWNARNEPNSRTRKHGKIEILNYLRGIAKELCETFKLQLRECPKLQKGREVCHYECRAPGKGS